MLKYFRKIYYLIQDKKIKKRYLPLYIILRILAMFILKYDKRIFTFNLSDQQPKFIGYYLSNNSYKITSQVCLLLQGPINKFNKSISKNFAKKAKKELGVGYVIYVGPDANEMKSFCDISLQVDVGTERDQFRLQQMSTLKGLNYIIENLDFLYTLKVRADALILRRDAILLFLLRLNKNFKNKLVVTSQQKPYYSPFISDHLQFGKTIDLQTLWNKKWEGYLDIKLTNYNEKHAPSPEWVLGNSFQNSFAEYNFAICTDYEIHYKLLKYDFYDVYNFDWESSPHFSIIKDVPSVESNITHVEREIIEYFGNNAYEQYFKF